MFVEINNKLNMFKLYYKQIFGEICHINQFQDLIYLGESDIKDLGLKNGAHRAKIVSSLRLLKDRYERGNGICIP